MDIEADQGLLGFEVNMEQGTEYEISIQGKGWRCLKGVAHSRLGNVLRASYPGGASRNLPLKTVSRRRMMVGY